MPRTAAYAHTLDDLELPQLLLRAEQVSSTTASYGWQWIQDAIAEHERRMTAQLLNRSTKADDVPYLRGLLAGLASAREAAETIQAIAREREAEAKRALEHA